MLPRLASNPWAQAAPKWIRLHMLTIVTILKQNFVQLAEFGKCYKQGPKSVDMIEEFAWFGHDYIMNLMKNAFI
jgi:hypothetical protein